MVEPVAKSGCAIHPDLLQTRRHRAQRTKPKIRSTELKEPNPRSLRMQLGAGGLTTLRIAYTQHEMFEGEEQGI
jgi:hypothetical protein